MNFKPDDRFIFHFVFLDPMRWYSAV
jgi:hypothetical protein